MTQISALGRVFREFFIAVKQYLTVLGFIGKNQLSGYILKAALMAFLTFSIILVGAVVAGNALHGMVGEIDAVHFENELLNTILYWVTYLLIMLPLVFVTLLLYKSVFQAVLAPMLGKVVEKVLSVKTGREIKPSISVGNSLKGFWKIALPNVFKELLLLGVLFVVGWVPLLTIVAGPLMFVVSSYFLGASSLDLVNETLEVDFEERKKEAGRHFGYVLGNGAGFMLLFAIPILGTFTAPVISVITAAMGYDKLNREDSSN
ncbi:EI24 domain-containing protein [Limibacter armeniacum]|uniref:EI24 domain-containing protein n=1 Tax=Limibacter armeniacum TaxID=466084 RepID=UPI002FE5FF70